MRLFMPMAMVVAGGTLAVAAGTLWLGHVFHQFEDFPEESAIDCTPVVGITGASDIEDVPGENAAFLSVLDQRGDAERGGIIRFDFDNPLDDSSWRDRTEGRPVLFKPGGIDLYRERLASGVMRERLFVVNQAGPEVLIFDVSDEGGLILAERLTTPELTSPNDVVATGPTSFFVTNDTASGRQTVRGKADFLLGLPTGSILRYSGSEWSVAADKLRFPNGLALSSGGDRLYAAEMRAEAIRQFARDPATGALEEGERVMLDSFPNNLSVDDEGYLYVGSVPQPFAFKAFTEELSDIAPSQVLRIRDGRTETLLQSAGRDISAATAATMIGDRLVIGTAADDRFMMCDAI
jgi:arylesterase/paraoxonase